MLLLASKADITHGIIRFAGMPKHIFRSAHQFGLQEFSRRVRVNIKIVATFENAREYLTHAKINGADANALWTKHMIEPFWGDIAVYAPFDQSFKQPPRITEFGQLEKQLLILSELDVADLKSKFTLVTNALPSGDDDPMLVALYPLCNSNKTVKEWQNGIVGASVFGNMVISINPLADDWQKWIPFVFAHEYHHNIWGHNWYVMRGGKDLDGSFLQYMITEGQADLFAMSLFPDLTPQWNQPFNTDKEEMLWEQIKPILYSTDHKIHEAYMFGDKEKGLPWCMGYSFGRMIVTDYLQKNAMPFSQLLNIPAKQIFEGSRFYNS